MIVPILIILLKGETIMTNSKKLLALTMCIMLLATSLFTINVSAATTTKNYNCDNTVTMTVKTGNKSANMKFVCNAKKSSITVNRAFFGKKTYTHTCSKAPKMCIKVTPAVNGKNYYYLQGKGKSIASTLKLEKNKTYTIQVSYYKNSCNLCSCDTTSLNLFHAGEAVATPRYYANGTWKVSSSKNANITNIKVR